MSFISPGLHLNIRKTEETLQFGIKSSRRAWQEVKTRRQFHTRPKHKYNLVVALISTQLHLSYNAEYLVFL